MANPRINYKQKYELEKELRMMFVWISVFAIVGILAFVGFSLWNDKSDVPKKLGSIYYDGEGSAFVRFDLTDQKQLVLLNALKQVCTQGNVTNCMDSVDVLGLRGDK